MENAIRTYLYLITSILRNITSQLPCISASAAGSSAIPVTDECTSATYGVPKFTVGFEKGVSYLTVVKLGVLVY